MYHDHDVEYEVASTEFSLAQSRRMLAGLHGHDLEEFQRTAVGDCHDCATTGVRVIYGRLHLCRRCAARRNRARSLTA